MTTPTLEPHGATTTQVPLYNRRRVVVGHAVIDDDHALVAKVNTHRWFNIGGYAATRMPAPTRATQYLHQLLWQHFHGSLPTPPLQIDHRDRRKLNNVIANLRAADPSTQAANKGRRADNRSGFKGVCHYQRSSHGRVRYYWVARVKRKGLLVLDRQFPQTPQGLRAAARSVNDAYRLHYPDLDIPNPEAEKPGALSGT